MWLILTVGGLAIDEVVSIAMIAVKSQSTDIGIVGNVNEGITAHRRYLFQVEEQEPDDLPSDHTGSIPDRQLAEDREGGCF